MDELIKTLREHAEWAEVNQWEVPITLSDDLRKAADELEKRRWIPVEERLPENYELVVWWIVPSIGEKYGFVFPSSFYEKRGAPESATHWMPLTAPPKEDKS